MAYFLGRDVKVGITTESAGSFTLSSNVAAVGAAITANGDNIEVLGGLDVQSNAIAAGEVMNDVTGVEVTLGAIDEDIAYMGQRTALKAEIKKETTITITKKRSSGFWSSMWAKGYRWGASAASTVQDGDEQPGTTWGYRLFVGFKENNEYLTVPGCTFSEYSATLSADGVQEETLTFISHITPTVGAGPDESTAIGSATYPL